MNPEFLVIGSSLGIFLLILCFSLHLNTTLEEMSSKLSAILKTLKTIDHRPQQLENK